MNYLQRVNINTKLFVDMVKKSNKKSQFFVDKLIALKPWGWLIITVITLVSIIPVKNFIEQKRIEHKFLLLSKELRVTQMKIRDNLPNLEMGKITGECYNQSVKFSKGQLLCELSFDIAGPLDIQTVGLIENAVQSGKVWNVLEQPNRSEFPYSDGVYENTKTKQQCRGGYSRLASSTKDNQLFEYKFSCTSESHESFYLYRDLKAFP